MRRRPLLWMTVSVLCFLAAMYFWHLGNQWSARQNTAPETSTNDASRKPQDARAVQPAFQLTTSSAHLSPALATPTTDQSASNLPPQLVYRVTNTSKTIAELSRDPRAVLLENALLDTASPLTLAIPDHLRAKAEPGAYIVQSRGPLDNAFRSVLTQAGAQLVSYIPNHSYLVRASAQTARVVASHSRTAAVLPYEPYYKLKSVLLEAAMEGLELPPESQLNVLLFADAREQVLEQLGGLGVEVVGEERSPFGPVVRVRAPAAGWTQLAGWSGVQALEFVRERLLANDLSRAALGVSVDTVVTNNYLGLEGSTNVLVAVVDTGVDESHPDLVGRVVMDDSTNWVVGPDINGHGTHVAGIIAGDGKSSAGLTNIPGSITPTVEGQLRGKAPRGLLYAMNYQAADTYLQEQAARTNALISNNSWTYDANEYDLAAASYDAAVRDALPFITGSQPVAYVFPAGNGGAANSYFAGPFDGGLGGVPSGVRSPGTAKNVITVGALEQARNVPIVQCTTNTGCLTNTLPTTDSDDEVAGFSNRGNVGIGIEGKAGRFKPDLVTPATFILSTRSQDWLEEPYYNPTSYLPRAYANLQVSPGGLYGDAIYVPANAVSVEIRVQPNLRSPTPFPILPIYVRQSSPPTNTAGGYDFVELDNNVMMPPDNGPILTPRNEVWYFAVGNNTSNIVSFDLVTLIALTNVPSMGGYTNDTANPLVVLSNLNESVKPNYRYESGTSLAAAQVAGMLSLLEGFFLDRHRVTNSPALMKALLINGARSAGDNYDFQVKSAINYQGWGKPNLVNSLPVSLSDSNFVPNATTRWKLFFDQSPTNALATGQSHRYNVELETDARDLPLRITLVWTDPPANPLASIKLVNDLDLIVTNRETGEVYFGNDIGVDAELNAPWNPTNPPPPLPDNINNVENVFLSPSFFASLGTNFDITVVGRAVNVNAVTAHANDVVQDYALVISSGTGEVTNALRLVIPPVYQALTTPLVTDITNMFGETSTERGGVLKQQHVGANTPLLGTNQIPLGQANGVITLGLTNQWHFYTLDNDVGFTNAAFLTFTPPNLAVPRMGTRVQDPDNAARPEADIDLYVSMDPDLTNLSPAALQGAWKSLGPYGTETIVLSNATQGRFYIGVKSEDQQTAEFAILGLVSLLPFGSEENGNQLLRGVPVPRFIPDGSPREPGGVDVFAFAQWDTKLHRVIVSNAITHELYGDLVGTLTHDRDFATLNNHATNILADNGSWFFYDDSEELNIPDAQHTDGPGSLHDFAGKEGIGAWILTLVDNAEGHVGYVNNHWIYLERQLDPTEGIVATLPPGGCREDFIDVPADATNLTVSVTILSGAGPVSLTVCPLIGGPLDCVGVLISNAVSDSVTIDTLSNPPLGPGTYSIRTCNLGPAPVQVYILARLYIDPNTIAVTAPSTSEPIAIIDDAVTNAFIDIPRHLRILDLDVGLLINHPRVSDLAITLISPSGTRVVLFENRGAWSTNGLGSFSTITNELGLPLLGYTNMGGLYTNDLESAAVGAYAAGAKLQGWTVLSNMVAVVPDLTFPWLSNNVLVLADGAISNSLPTTFPTEYRLDFKASHAPFLVGTVGWWPFDEDGRDIFSALDATPWGDVVFAPGWVGSAFFGDGSATRAIVPRSLDINVGLAPGFSVEGWIYPARSTVPSGIELFADGFEDATPAVGIPAGSTVSGWLVESGDVDVMTSGAGFIGLPDTGLQALDLNGWVGGSISREFTTKPGTNYVLSFAYTKNPSPALPGYPDFVARANLLLTGQPTRQLQYSGRNDYTNLNWAHTSIVFTATAALTKLQLTSLNSAEGGLYLDSFKVVELTGAGKAAPIAQWSESTNGAVPGVSFWYSGLPGTNLAGSLWADVRDTNGLSHVLNTAPLLLTNAGWQHVALTYRAQGRICDLYVNGAVVASSALGAGPFQPATASDLYFGYDPNSAAAGRAFHGGLDEFGLYERALTPGEIRSIFRAGFNGKYGTNVLNNPVVTEVTLLTPAPQTYIFTNGLAWTNGPRWELNSLRFAHATTNLTPILVRPLSANVALDDLVLSGLVTNYISGLLHFNDDTNVSPLPIKFAPTPFVMSNFPPVGIFTNAFELATPGVYLTNDFITGTNISGFGPRNWLVTDGTVAVVSNGFFTAPGGTNYLVLSQGRVETLLPTTPGRRYQLTYAVRGPGAVGWWTGDINPLNRRALDLLGGNDGAFIYGATNESPGLVAGFPNRPTTALHFPGFITNGINGHPDIATKVELGDPENLRLTNAITIETWIRPDCVTNAPFRWQIFYRGDSRACLDPFYLALEQRPECTFDLQFHVEDELGAGCGFDLRTTNAPINADQWQHVAAVFDSRVPVIDGGGRLVLTNEVRLYVDGTLRRREFTRALPFRNLDPGFSPGISIGNRSRSDTSEWFTGSIDELTVYGRALADFEIRAIHDAGVAGKADFAVAPASSLARVSLWLNNVETEFAYGDNARWTARTFEFTASRTNTLVGFKGLLPGTLLYGFEIIELPAELSYQPEQPLDILNGEDAFGRWQLEIWDNRVNAFVTNEVGQLVSWQLDFKLAPMNPAPAISLSHGIVVTNSLPANNIQNYIVQVPQWATRATNVLFYVVDQTNNPANVGVLYDTNGFPQLPTNNTPLPLFWPPVYSDFTVLNTNTSSPRLMVGNPYFLSVTNTNSFSVTYALGVWFDITTLTNCALITNYAGPAGIPRYFQFDVPTNTAPPELWPRNLNIWLRGANTNLTVVASQHLPLPDLGHHDYLSMAPATNQEVVMVLTNTTPFPIETNRWYIGIFNTGDTNVPFTLTACYTTNYPLIIPLTNNVPFNALVNNPFVARPGPPRAFFFEFRITNWVESALFELYGLSGDADLVLQRDVPPAMAPYFDFSVMPGLDPEQIVIRPSAELPDLRGNWYLGIFNTETNDVTYTLRAVTGSGGMLLSAQALRTSILPVTGQGPLIGWNAVRGENYVIQYATSLRRPIIWNKFATVVATTPFATFQVPVLASGATFYRVVQVIAPPIPPPTITLTQLSPTQLELSWPTTYGGLILQYAVGESQVWYDWDTTASPITVVGNNFVTIDTIGPVPRYYRLAYPYP